VGYSQSSRRVTKADLQREADAAFQLHRQKCAACSTYDNKTMNLGRLCLTGSMKFKTAIALHAI